MATPRPVVWETATFPSFIRYISSDLRGASTIVVCCAKADFLSALQNELGSPSDGSDSVLHEDPSANELRTPHTRQANDLLDSLARPTLQLLSICRNVRLVFCSDITHLRAYLATYTARQLPSKLRPASRSTELSFAPILAVFNLVQLHRPTSAFSAQGLNRTMANAVEAAVRSKSQLIILECHLMEASTDVVDGSNSPAVTDGGQETPGVWDEQISILNVTTKSFGVGDKGWAGRTTTARSVAERWCAFVDQLPTRR